jgi:hypothetical protein
VTPEERDRTGTSDEFDALMSKLIGNVYKGANPARYVEYVAEVRTRYGHKPIRVLRFAVGMMLTQGLSEAPYVGDDFWGMWVREAERQLSVVDRVERGLLPLDEERQEKEQRENYGAIYDRVGPGTEPFEWNLCLGIAKMRKRKRLLEKKPDLDTAAVFRSPQEKEDFGAGLDEPTEAEIRDVYAERRDQGIAIGKSPTATSRQASRDNRGERPALRDPARWLREGGGFKSSRELLEERRAAGRLEPRMEEYLLDKIREEESRGAE